MEFSPQTLSPGTRFSPYDEELVQYYLYPKVTNPLFTPSAPVRDCDIYAYQPLQIWNAFHRIHGEDVFFFTNLKKKSPASNIGNASVNVTRKIAGGPASWHREDSDKNFHVTIDNHCSVTATRKGFSYRNPDDQSSHHGHWTMYEYSLPSLSEVTVLCQLRRKDDSKTRTRRMHDGGVGDATNTTSKKARVGEGYHQQQITAAPAETESEIARNQVSLDNLEAFLQNDIDNDQMDISSEELEDRIQELRGVLLNGRGGSDLADGLPSIQTTPEADANLPYVVQENGVELIYFPDSNG